MHEDLSCRDGFSSNYGGFSSNYSKIDPQEDLKINPQEGWSMTPAMLTPHSKSAKSSLEAVHVHRGFRVLGQSTWRHSRRWRQIASAGLPCHVVIAYEALGTRGIAREQTNLKPTGPCATVGCSPRTRCRDHRHRYFGEQGVKDSRSQVQLGLIWAREQGRFPFFLSYVQDYLSVHTGLLT
jgi:hypothetical protein